MNPPRAAWRRFGRDNGKKRTLSLTGKILRKIGRTPAPESYGSINAMRIGRNVMNSQKNRGAEFLIFFVAATLVIFILGFILGACHHRPEKPKPTIEIAEPYDE